MQKSTLYLCAGAVAGLLGLLFAFFLFVPGSFSGTAYSECATSAAGGLPAPGGGGGTVKPVENVDVTSPFGGRSDPTDEGSEFHRGIDLGGPEGTSIYAYAPGVVAAAGQADGFGQWIVLNHTIAGKKVSTVYGHMWSRGVLVKQGQRVKAGQEIARIGANGNVTGPHLHFEYWVGGYRLGGGHPVDPYPYVQAARPPKLATAGGPAVEQVSGPGGPGPGDDDRDDPLGGFQLPKPDGAGEQGGMAGGVPSDYLAAYKAAGAQYGVPWQLLAGIGWTETKHGTSNLPGVHSGENEAGAGGPMQFLEGTWEQYGVDGDNSGGAPNRYDIGDAAFGAANYLVASGVKNGPQGVWDALWAYNHSHAYANDVLSYAWDYAKGDIRILPGGVNGECSPGGVVITGKADTSHGSHGYRGRGQPDTTWPDEQATVDDPTTSGKLTPRMAKALRAIKTKAPSKPASIGCWRPNDQFPDHPGGYACDLMFTPANTTKNVNAGWAMANWLVKNQKALAVKYVIWQGKIWSAYKETGHWRPYTVNGCPDRSMVTTCHYDHVHVTVY
ncbi:MAG: peptidoglycan DD-metalloendopeptidase family protein [Streptosporangiales bacterium]